MFIFGEGCFPAVIRVSVEHPHRTATDVLSELMWIDDLKNDVTTVCQPLPSLENRMVERISVNGMVYLATMFRKANGSIFPAKDWTPRYFYDAGVLLGKIHRTSSEGYQNGFRYKRRHWDEHPFYDFAPYDKFYSPQVRADAEAVLRKIQSIPRTPLCYGMIHGDYHSGNMFCDWGDLWAFDFDDCCYGYFMFDIVCIAHIGVNSMAYASKYPDITARDRLLGQEGILTQIRAGYSTQWNLPDEQWELFDDFFRLRVAQIMNIHILLKMYPVDMMLVLDEPMAEYLKYDRSPIDKIEGVRRAFKERLTPEQIAILSKGITV